MELQMEEGEDGGTAGTSPNGESSPNFGDASPNGDSGSPFTPFSLLRGTSLSSWFSSRSSRYPSPELLSADRSGLTAGSGPDPAGLIKTVRPLSMCFFTMIGVLRKRCTLILPLVQARPSLFDGPTPLFCVPYSLVPMSPWGILGRERLVGY